MIINSDKRNTVCLIGTNSLIANQLEKSGYTVLQYGRKTNPGIDFTEDALQHSIENVVQDSHTSRFIIFSGYLNNKKITDQRRSEIVNSMFINSIGPVLFCEYVLEKIENARIILIGSESGIKGSYDLSYALAKSSLRMYIRQRKVKPEQQLVLVSPSTISDLGMTRRRKDLDRLNTYRTNHPKKRFLDSLELSHILKGIMESSVYLTNTEIELCGGKFASMCNNN